MAKEVELPYGAHAGSRARAFLDEHFRDFFTRDAFASVQLVVSELVNNAFVHGAGPISLKIERLGDGGVRVEVVDQGTTGAPEIRARAADQSGGWGMHIVDSLSRSWGVFEGSTHVWAELSFGAGRDDSGRRPVAPPADAR